MPQSEVPWTEDRDTWWHEAVDHQPASCDVTWMDAEAPLFKASFLTLADASAYIANRMSLKEEHQDAWADRETRTGRERESERERER